MPRFEACHPDSMKCVSTLNDAGYPAFDAVPYTCSAADAQATIVAVVQSQKRTKIVAEEPGFVDTTFTSLVFRFTDTVQFELDDEAKVIHFRSESVPYAGSDLGANRKRMELVTKLLVEQLPS